MHILAGVLLSGVGSLIALLGLRLLAISRRLVREGGRALATVVRHDFGGGKATPVVEFVDDRGVTRQTTLDGIQPGAAVGAEVNVLYDRENPETAFADTPLNLWMLPALCFVVAGVALAFGLLILIGVVPVS